MLTNISSFPFESYFHCKTRSYFSIAIWFPSYASMAIWLSPHTMLSIKSCPPQDSRPPRLLVAGWLAGNWEKLKASVQYLSQILQRVTMHFTGEKGTGTLYVVLYPLLVFSIDDNFFFFCFGVAGEAEIWHLQVPIYQSAWKGGAVGVGCALTYQARICTQAHRCRRAFASE